MAMKNNIKVDRSSLRQPLVAHKAGGLAVVSFGAPMSAKSGTTTAKTDHITPQASFEETVGAYAGHWVPWGHMDDQPRKIALMMRKSPMGRPALMRRAKAIYGQRQFVYKVTGYDDNGNAQIKHQVVPEWEDIKRRSNFDVIRLAMAQDYAYYDMNFPEIMFNDNKTKVWKVDYQKTSHCRLALIDPNTGYIPYVFVSGRFPNAQMDTTDIVKSIDFLRWPDQLDDIRKDYKTFRYLMPQFWPDVLNDYYPEAFWMSAKDHIEINIMIPIYMKAVFRNQASIKYHIQIPYSYLTDLYPNFKSMSEEEQDTIIDNIYDEIVDKLTGAENAQKALMTFYTAGLDGKPKDGWIINTIDDKLQNDQYFMNETVSASIIQFAFMQNPAISGQGNTGGNYTGGSNNGGSNIRESTLDYRQLQQADRDICNSFFSFIRDFNGWDPDLQLGTQDTILTTLDTGAGTGKVLS